MSDLPSNVYPFLSLPFLHRFVYLFSTMLEGVETHQAHDHELTSPPSFQLELSPYLRQDQVNIAWCTVFLQTVSKAVPASVMMSEVADREKHHWWKAKKWAYFNLNRLFIR
jgi:hypothetical protein